MRHEPNIARETNTGKQNKHCHRSRLSSTRRFLSVSTSLSLLLSLSLPSFSFSLLPPGPLSCSDPSWLNLWGTALSVQPTKPFRVVCYCISHPFRAAFASFSVSLLRSSSASGESHYSQLQLHSINFSYNCISSALGRKIWNVTCSTVESLASF